MTRVGDRWRGLAGAVALAVLTGCGAEPAADPTAAPEPVRLGALVPLSGTNAQSGREMRDAAQMAVDEINAAGGVLGRRVELLVRDDACDPGTAVVEANKLVAAGVTVSVGGYCSSATVPTLKIFRTASVPMVIPLSNSTDLLAPGYDSVFLICGTVRAEGAFAVDAMRRLGTRRLAVIDDGTSFPVTLRQATVEAAGATGSTISVVATLSLSQGAPSYARLAAQVLAAGVDTVSFTGYYGEANQLITDLRRAGYDGRIVVGDGAADGPLLANLTPEQAKDVYGTALMVPALMPRLAEWSRRFETRDGHTPGPAAPEAYDAVTVAVDAVRRAGSTDRGAVRAAIAATDGLSLLSGTARFNPDGTRVDPTFLLLTARDGELVEAPG